METVPIGRLDLSKYKFRDILLRGRQHCFGLFSSISKVFMFQTIDEEDYKVWTTILSITIHNAKLASKNVKNDDSQPLQRSKSTVDILKHSSDSIETTKLHKTKSVNSIITSKTSTGLRSSSKNNANNNNNNGHSKSPSRSTPKPNTNTTTSHNSPTKSPTRSPKQYMSRTFSNDSSTKDNNDNKKQRPAFKSVISLSRLTVSVSSSSSSQSEEDEDLNAEHNLEDISEY
eukprot:TRINITY_DN2875_c0_g1_i3.p1 TRINITY_DN2875_c0_g1~~TRINITY_DN2875_c0_g1_i3.p1  ORF type:complete len:230 (-),score=57.49 TRINITY_DN2875_c0_g1_i3:291-980(-)